MHNSNQIKPSIDLQPHDRVSGFRLKKKAPLLLKTASSEGLTWSHCRRICSAGFGSTESLCCFRAQSFAFRVQCGSRRSDRPSPDNLCLWDLSENSESVSTASGHESKKERKDNKQRTDEWTLISLSESRHGELEVNRKIETYPKELKITRK